MIAGRDIVAAPDVRCLSLLQPWASLMALLAKRIETRSWSTRYRGLVAIASSARWNAAHVEWATTDPDCVAVWRQHGIESVSDLPLGMIVCVGRLVDCIRSEAFDTSSDFCGESEAVFGNYASGRFAWVFDDLRCLERPIPVKGRLGLYTVSPALRAAIAAELPHHCD